MSAGVIAASEVLAPTTGIVTSGLGLSFPSPGPNQIALVTALKGTTSFVPSGAGSWVEMTSRNQNNRIGRLFLGYNFTGVGTVTVITPTAWATRHIYDVGHPVTVQPAYTVGAYGLGGNGVTTGAITPAIGDILFGFLSGPGGVAADGILSQVGGNNLGNLLKDGNTSNHICGVTSVAVAAVSTTVSFTASSGSTQQAVLCKIAA